MVKYREILRLHAMGVSIRNIAFSCRCSTATVRAVAGRAKAAGIEWPLPEEMGDRAIREVIYPPKSKASRGRRQLFRSAPLHRWLELRGQSAEQIFYTFCVIAMLGVALTVQLAKIS